VKKTPKKMLSVVVGVLAVMAPAVHAQQAADASPESPIPMIVGSISFQSSFEHGDKTLSPQISPILLVPLGQKLLVEAEYDMESEVTHSDGAWGPTVVDHGIEYLQLDYIAHPNLTFTVGRFLTPFGIYRERLHPMWIRNLAGESIIFALNDNSSNGAMVRGAAGVTSGINVTYAAYFSAATTNNQLAADRRAGTRVSLFFPDKRFEVGVSFSRVLGDAQYNMVGTDLTWNLRRVPLDIRAEAVQTSLLGRGYWVEAAYRLDRLGKNALLRNSLLALRGEQYRVPGTPQELFDELPDRNTSRATLGWTYSLYNGVRFNASYAHNFAKQDQRNIWTVGFTYRFAAF
jgi:hypothetical protein